MEILENGLYSRMYPTEFKHLRDLSSGSYGKVVEILHKPTNSAFAMKVIEVCEQSPENLIRSEIQFLQQLHELPQKPSIFPNFYGFFLSFDETTGKRTFCLLFELKKRSLNDLVVALKGQVPFELFSTVLLKLVNGLSYLQTLSICHRDLKPQNILIDDESNAPSADLALTLIDFGISKRILVSVDQTTQEMTVIGTESYLSPELRMASEDRVEVNPYKSDVFSLGMVLLKLAIGKMPFLSGNMEFEIKKLIKEIGKKFLDQAAGSIEITRKIEKVMDIFKDMLEIDPKQRPDFIELFFRTLRLEENVENIRNMILLRENQGFTLIKHPANQANFEEEKKTDFFFSVLRNSSIEPKRINQNYQQMESFLQAKGEVLTLNLVINGAFLERMELANKILASLGLRDDILELPNSIIEINSPYLVEISYGEAYKSDSLTASNQKTSTTYRSLEELRKGVKETLANNAILLLSMKEKPFIYQRVTLKEHQLKNYRLFLVNNEFKEKKMGETLEECLAAQPTLFLKLKGIEMEKYDTFFLKLFRRIERKVPCAFWTIFWKENKYLQSFKFENSDTEKSLILKKNSKLTRFQEILTLEETILGSLTPNRKVIFLQEDNPMLLLEHFLDFRYFSQCERALFLMIRDSKTSFANGDNTIKLLDPQRVEDLIGKIGFFGGELGAQVEVFFSKLHQGSLEEMRKNSLFLQEAEKIAVKGIEVLKSSQSYLSKRTFVKDVMEFLMGELQDFMRRTVWSMIYPFIELILRESIAEFGRTNIEKVLGWQISEDLDEKAPEFEKLVLGLLIKEELELSGRINERLLLNKVKCLNFKEDSLKQVSSYSTFWGYDGTKDDILQMILINLRENKPKNINQIVEIFNELSNGFFNRLRRFPAEGGLQVNNETQNLQKETLNVVGRIKQERKGLFSKENLAQLGDEGLKEVLQIKVGFS